MFLLKAEIGASRYINDKRSFDRVFDSETALSILTAASCTNKQYRSDGKYTCNLPGTQSQGLREKERLPPDTCGWSLGVKEQPQGLHSLVSQFCILEQQLQSKLDRT